MRWIAYLDDEGNAHHAWTDHPDAPWRHWEGPLWAGDPTSKPVIPGPLLAPILLPPAIFAIGLNYHDHMIEMGSSAPQHPMLFMKNPACVTGPDSPILLPRTLRSDKVDFEAELAVVIGKPARNISESHALDFVLGYTCANDISARDWQKEWGGGQFCRGKSFDTFCPLGPVLVGTDEISDPGTLTLTTRLNGVIMQHGRTADMLFSVARLVAFLSGDTTLLPGTIIITGTPAGVGSGRTPPVYLQPGDILETEIDRIGTLRNGIAEAGPFHAK